MSKDESALAQALGVSSGTTSSGGSGSPPAGNSGTPPTQSSHTTSASTPGATLSAAITSTSGSNGTGSAPAGAGGASANTDTPAQIASDQSTIDTAEAQLTEAEQSLSEATLTSPITGTVVSVAISAGDTVSANSSTEIITIIGTDSYEAEATLDPSQVPTVKVGQSATVQVDGVQGSFEATVAQVGPVQSSTSGYSYPVVVALPATSKTLHAGSAANVTISTGSVSHVLAVPTSAVQTAGSASYVTVLENGASTRKVIKIGMVGSEYTQVVSGLNSGETVVLADYSEAVPSSSSNSSTTGGLSNILGGGSTGFPGGGFGGGGRFPGIGVRVGG